MAKKKPPQNPPQSLGEIELGKPDFEQALSFAEAVPHPVGVQENAPGPAEHRADQAVPALPLAEPADRAGAQPGQSAAALMPQDAAARKVLEERALTIARQAGEQRQEQGNQYLRFRLGAVERYGIPYQYLEELLYVGHLARVPCTPAFVAGVVNHRGELLTILDLKHFFHMPATAAGEESRIIVVRRAGMRIGLLVDGVDGNEEYQDTEIAHPLSSEGVSNMEHVLGIHAGSVTLLNMAAFLDDPALRVNR